MKSAKEFYFDQASAVESAWILPEERSALYDLAKACTGAGCIVEIGTWHGCSAIVLGGGAKAGEKNVHVYAIDPLSHDGPHAVPWDTKPKLDANLAKAGMDGVVTHIRDFSTKVARWFKEPVELLWIDGDHSYEGVRGDFEAWFPKVVLCGTVAIHDSTPEGIWPGVVKFCGEIAPLLDNVRTVRTMMIGNKKRV